MSHRVGAHSDDRGGDSDLPCDCEDRLAKGNDLANINSNRPLKSLKSAIIPPSNSSNEELESKLVHLFRRMSVCAATHQGKDAHWIDGQCVTPTTAAKEAMSLLQSERQSLLAELEAKLPEKDTTNYQGSYAQTYRKGVNDFRDQVLTIIKVLGEHHGG